MPNFENITSNNIIVRNSGTGQIQSDIINATTIRVGTLIVTDRLQVPLLDTSTVNPNDLEKVVVNKEEKFIPVNSGNLSYNNQNEDIVVEKNGVVEDISSNNGIGNINSILFETLNNSNLLVNNVNSKFRNLQHTICFNGVQPPNSENFILGSDNNINFLNDDSSFYLFEGFVIGSVKNKVFNQFGSQDFLDKDGNQIKLKKMKVNYTTYLIKNGLIKLQENDISGYETICLASKIYNNSFTLKKLNNGNKCYFSIETKNLTDFYVNWKAQITITRINVYSKYRPEINNFDFYHLKNNPEESLFKWDCYSTGSNSIFYRVNKRISFGTVPLHSLSKKNNDEILCTVFHKDKNILDINDLNGDLDEIVRLNENSVLKDDNDDVIIFNSDFTPVQTTLVNIKSLIVRDTQKNQDSCKPFSYKSSIYLESDDHINQKINYVKSKGFFISNNFTNPDTKVKQSEFFSTISIDYPNNKINNHVYLVNSLIQGKEEYFDFYFFNMIDNFTVNLVPADKIHEFKNNTFLIKKNEYLHYFIYKDIDTYSDTFKSIYLSNNLPYYFDYGTINLLEADIVIIDSDTNSPTYNKSRSIKIYADIYIPTFQDIRSDLINKILKDKLDKNEINNYLKYAYDNPNFINIKTMDIDDPVIYKPIIDTENSYIENATSEILFSDFSFQLKIGIPNYNFSGIDVDNYATISSFLSNLSKFYLDLSVKSSLNKDYQVSILFKNEISDIFSI